MTTLEARLQAACRRGEETITRLVHWSGQSRPLLEGREIVLERALSDAARQLRVLARASARPPTIGLAGPAGILRQAVVQGLADASGQRLTAQINGLPYGIDIAAYLAPEPVLGSAVAVRYARRSRPNPPDFPIVARLLSFADLVRILAAAHLGDCADTEPVPPDRDTVRRHMDHWMVEVGPYTVPGMTAEDVERIRDEIETDFADEPLVRSLAASGFWERSAQGVARLSDSARVGLFSLLWSQDPALTAILEMLSDAAARLGHSAEGYLPLEAVVRHDAASGAVARREDSVLSAATALRGSGRTDTVTMRSQKGHAPQIPRAAAAALLAEVRLTLAESGPGADGGAATGATSSSEVLDLPWFAGGALAAEAATADGPFRSMAQFVCAKCQFLLRRATLDGEVSSLVVAVTSDLTDLRRLPQIVTSWIETTHGCEPCQREGADPTLLVAVAPAERPDACAGLDAPDALSQAVAQSLTAGAGWAREWSPGRPFDRVVILGGRENGEAASVEGPRAELQPLTVSLTALQGPLPRPARLPARGSGAGRTELEAALVVCRCAAELSTPRIKARQTAQGIARTTRGILARLTPYRRASDVGRLTDQRHRAANVAVARLACVADRGRFGHLLRALTPSSEELSRVLFDAEVAAVQAGADAEGTAGLYARVTFRHWLAAMGLSARNPVLARTLGIDQDTLATIIDELADGAIRLQLEPAMARALQRPLMRGLGRDERTISVSVSLAELIAGYVRWLGFEPGSSMPRPRRWTSAELPIFPARYVTGLAVLTSGSASIDVTSYAADWRRAYLALVVANTAGIGDLVAGDEASRRLEDIARPLEGFVLEAEL